jgi:hypothetical protein
MKGLYPASRKSAAGAGQGKVSMANLTRDLILDKPFNMNIERAIYRGPKHWIVEVSWLNSPGEYPTTRVVFSGVDTVTSRYDVTATSTEAGSARRQCPATEPNLVRLRDTHQAIERRLRRIAEADHQQLIAEAEHQNYYEIVGIGEFLPIDRMWIRNIRDGQWMVSMGRVEEIPGIFCEETFTFTFTGSLVAEEEHHTEKSSHKGPDVYPRFGGGGGIFDTAPRSPGL